VPFPFVQTLEGTPGDTAGAGVVGSDSVAGTGSAVFAAGGIGPGTSSHVHITGQRGYRNIVEGATTIWTSVWFRADDGNPAGDSIVVHHYDSGGSNLSGWQIDDEGKLKCLAGEAPDGSTPLTERSYSDGRAWYVRHRDVRSLGRQDFWVHRDSGKLVEDWTADVRAGSHYRTEYGITNSADPSYEINVSLAKGQATTLYPEVVHLDRWRWFATDTYVSIRFQTQGGPYARVTTGGPMAPRVSDPVAVDEFGWAEVTIPSLPVPGTVYTHLVDVGDGEDSWSPTVDVYTTKTQRGLS
jgi:hypothetical protein